MADAPGEGRPTYILAAGGLLERVSADGVVRIAVVHRHRYGRGGTDGGDWVLPKGKLDPGETLEEAALREVEEETGCRGRIIGPPFFCEYLADGVPKVTTFFRMGIENEGVVSDSSEVAEVVWLELQEARERLSYAPERSVLEQAYAGVLKHQQE